MTRQQIVFIGGGNMTRSLAGGLVADGYPPERIRATDPDADQRERLAGRLGIEVGDDNRAAVADADVVVLAVKPQILREVAVDLGPALAARCPLVISIAAGVRIGDVGRWLGYDGPSVRCMPNTPALLQSGVTVLYPNAQVDADQRDAAESILRAVGTVIWLDDEALLDTVTAVSGGGPAYFFLFMEALEAAAVARGLGADQARLLVVETALGAARMALESGDDPATLRASVTSKGGTTAEALAELERGDLAGMVDRAIGAAAARAAELGDRLGAD